MLVRDATEGATGRGGYLVTGDLDPLLFNALCRFSDPVKDTFTVFQYQTAFEYGMEARPGTTVSLVAGPTVDREKREIYATLHLTSQVVPLPWRPRIKPYDTNLTWRLDDHNTVIDQIQHWSVSAADVLRQTYLPFPISTGRGFSGYPNS